jgi:hypothetical protein
VFCRAAVGKRIVSEGARGEILWGIEKWLDFNARSEILYMLSVPLTTSISNNNTIKWQCLHAKALQTQPDDHFGELV